MLPWKDEEEKEAIAYLFLMQVLCQHQCSFFFLQFTTVDFTVINGSGVAMKAIVEHFTGNVTANVDNVTLQRC